jgi:hypothetical protein
MLAIKVKSKRAKTGQQQRATAVARKQKGNKMIIFLPSYLFILDVCK